MRTELSFADRTLAGRIVGAALLGAALVAAGSLAGPGVPAASAREGGGLAGDAKCILCHEALARALPSTSHGAMEDGGHRCEACHGPGADHVGTAGNRGKIRSFRTDPAASVDACAACHGDAAAPEHARAFRGGPFEREGFTCVSCHRVHADARHRAAPRPRGEPSTAGCRACHADDVYGPRFRHAALEWDAPACASCHGGGAEHALDPARSGVVGNPARADPAAEAALCLRCHGGYAREVHFPGAAAEARCSTCHRLHREGSVGDRSDVAAAAKARPGDGTGTAPPGVAGDPLRLHGRVRVAGRAVGGERGRYAEQVDLDDGVRLELLEVASGRDDPDPDGVRAAIRASGIGDPLATAELRVARRGAWAVLARGSRAEHPFLGGGGLHPGETLRRKWGASVDVDVNRAVTVSAGHDGSSVRGDVRGTLLDGGAVLPVSGSQSHRDAETWARADAVVDGWRVGLLQGWRTGTGEDDRDRDAATAAGADHLRWRDRSSSRGPATAIFASGGMLDGAVEVDARVSGAFLDRDVDVTERRRGFAGAAPFTRTRDVAGDAERRLLGFALATAWVPADALAVEASVERRSLREERDLVARETLTTDLGTTTATVADGGDLRHAITDARLGARWTPRRGWTLRGGAERREDRLSGVARAVAGDRERVHASGVYLGGDTDLGGGWRASVEGRTTDARGAYTALTAGDRDAVAARVAWRGADGARLLATWRRTRTAADGSGLAWTGDAAALGGGASVGTWTVDAGASWRRSDLAVDALAFAGPGLRAAEASALVRAHSFDLRAEGPLSGDLRAEGAATWTRDRGDRAVRAWDASLALVWRPPGAVSWGVRLRRRRYDETRSSAGDFDARILEAFVEVEF